MLRFIRGRGHGSLSQDKVKELFALHNNVYHGFPHHPTALGYDPELGLIAVTSKRGILRIYGQPGVEYSADLDVESDVREIHFLPGQRGQLILLTEDGHLELWETVQPESTDAVPSLEKVKTWTDFVRGEGNVKAATTVEVYQDPSSVKDVPTRQYLLIGTESGDIHTIDLQLLEVVEDRVISQEAALSKVPSEYKKTSSQGAVEVIQQQPGRKTPNILIGYHRGLVLVWDVESSSPSSYYNSGQQLESASWSRRLDAFSTSHIDGSCLKWKVGQSEPQSLADTGNVPYGPFPCKPIGKVIEKTVKNGENFLFFSGGMPRATYGDRLTVSVIQGDPDKGKHHVLDFTSKVIDFVVVDQPDNDGNDNPRALIVLLEEEIVVVDLKHPDWLQFKLPYLSTIHFSGITACQLYSNISQDVFDSILEAGRKQDEGKFSPSSWPVVGGSLHQESTTSTSVEAPEEPATSPSTPHQVVKTNDLLVTGHEDGSVCFWNASDVNMYHVLTISTKKFFHATDDVPHIDGDESFPDSPDDVGSEWPPFRKVGVFDPFSDDPRLAIRQVALCPISGVFLAAGTAGQVLSFKVSSSPRDDLKLEVLTTNVVEESPGFVWKGHDSLHHKTGPMKVEAGFHPQFLLQMTPPASVKALTIQSEWNLIAAGTAHGFVVVDTLTNKVIFAKSTLNPADLAATAGGDALISRKKSFKKSLRESFRRLRRGRSSRKKTTSTPSSSPEKEVPSQPAEGTSASTPSSAATTPARRLVSSPVRSLASPEADLDDSPRPVERQIEARSDDGLGSMIRYLYFTPANITGQGVSSSTLFVGTNAGAVLVFNVTIPSKEKRLGLPPPPPADAEGDQPPQSQQDDAPGRVPCGSGEAGIDVIEGGQASSPSTSHPVPEDVTVVLAKEIQLKHRAPVIFIQVVDHAGYPIPGPFEVEKGLAKAPSTVGSQKVLIVSEEQFKLFTLPNLKPDRKSKLTAHDGSRIRRVTVGHFSSPKDDKVAEHVLVVSTNLGDVSIYTISDLKRVKTDKIVRNEDSHGISSVVLSSTGEGVFMHSPSEFLRFSLSSKKYLQSVGVVTINPDHRPKKPEPRAQTPAPVEEVVAAPSPVPTAEVVSHEERVLETVPEEVQEQVSVPVAERPKTPAKTPEPPSLPPLVEEEPIQVEEVAPVQVQPIQVEEPFQPQETVAINNGLNNSEPTSFNMVEETNLVDLPEPFVDVAEFRPDRSPLPPSPVADEDEQPQSLAPLVDVRPNKRHSDHQVPPPVLEEVDGVDGEAAVNGQVNGTNGTNGHTNGARVNYLD